MMSLPVTVSISVDNLNAAFLGQLKHDVLAVWFSQLRLANLKNFNAVLNLRNCDALFSHNVFAGDHD